jgi:tetratricopeptide (TPR) repeat protein
MKESRAQSIRTLVMVMVAVVIIGVVIARSYYGNINRSVDPRVVQARELYSLYNQYARTGDYYRIFALLDSIEQIYMDTEHYRGSFEMGVLENNSAAALLTIALYADSIPRPNNPFQDLDADSIVQLAMIHALRAIHTYETWTHLYDGLSEAEIRELIEPDFEDGLGDHDPAQVERFLSNRVREIETALRENDRRLSVCHTNLGVIYRHQGAYVEAAEQYQKALALWDRNLEAENNLNKLLNKPVKKRNLIQKLFPPNRGLK